MIRRISKKCDLKDIIKSCPSGVIDDIYAIEYYIQGNNVVINASFTQVGNELVVVLPTSQLELLPNGILMRRAFYKVVDTSYPDGYYNLEFEDNMNIWLGDYESEEPVIPEYVTEDSLSSTLSSYATQDWVSSQQFLTSDSLPSDLATKSWVQSQGYLTASTIPSDIATQSWVRSYTYDRSTIDYACGKAEDNAITWVQEQGYLTASTIPSDIATQSWVSSYFYTKSYIDEVEINNDLRMKAIEVSLDESYATMSWVQSQGYITVGDLPSGLATQSWVRSYTYDKSIIDALVGKAQGDAVDEVQTWVSSQQFATQQMVADLNSAIVSAEEHINGLDMYCEALSAYVDAFVSEFGSASYATQSWVRSYTYDSSTIDYACGKAEDNAITWVEEQGYVSTTDLSSYATKSWVSSNYFEESKIWTGTQAQWNALTSAQRATYTIALITQ